MESLFKTTEVENMTIVTAGKETQNPAELLSSYRMDSFVKEVRGRFDFVLFDSPPILSVADSIILADLTDKSIQIARSGKTPLNVLQKANEQLSRGKAEMLGVILNDFRYRHGAYYSYYNYYNA
jgi:capsular exopolysaccharide synthesis family protein